MDDEPRAHVTHVSKRLSLRSLTSDGAACSLKSEWVSSEYTHPVALNANVSGDVVAVVARCSSTLRWECDAYRLIVILADGTLLEPNIEASIDPSSTSVAISENGEFVVMTSRRQAYVHRVGEWLEPGPSIDLNECSETAVSFRSIAVSNDLSVAGVAVSKGQLQVVARPRSGPCSPVIPLDVDAQGIDVRFFGNGRFYVKTMAATVEESRFVVFEM